MDENKTQPLVRAMDDREVRLNCLLAAVNASTYMRSRMTDPLTIAEEFYQWVTEGITPAPARVQFGGQRPAVVEHGFDSGVQAPTAEAERADARQADTRQGDMIEVGRPPRPRS